MFGFWPLVNGWMLLWGFAALAPVLIHWLSRRRFRETPWAATRFLLAALRQRARRLRFEQWFLLALRVLALLLLAVALAEPQLPSTEIRAATGRSVDTHWLIVLDGSYSMDYRADGRTLFQQAQQRAQQLVSEARQGDGFTLLLMADPPQVIIREPAFDGGDVLREMDALQVYHTGADLEQTLDQVQKLIERARRRHPRLADTRVCFFTDLGATTWEATESAGVRRRLQQLSAEEVQLVVVPVGERTWSNAAVTRLEMLDPFATVDQSVRLLAEVQRMSSEQPRRVRVELRVDDKPVREENADLTTGAATVAFQHRFAVAGDHTVEVRLYEDNLEVDNRRTRVVVVRQSARVLCIEGQPGAARYVAYALEPRRTQRPRVRWEIATESALLERDLSQYECVFLCNVARLSDEEARLVASYVRAGGCLALLLGDAVVADSYNRMLGAGSETDLLPFQLGPVAPAGEYRFDPLEYRHPLVAPFQSQQRAGLLTVPTWRYHTLQLPPDSSARVALAFDNGAPALVEAEVGQGLVFAFASSPTPSASASSGSGEGDVEGWSEFAVWPSFPPVVQEMLALAVRQRDAGRDVEVGQPLAAPAPPGVQDGSLRIVQPDGNLQRVRLRRGTGRMTWVFGETYWSGIYRAQYDSPEVPAQLFSAAVNPRESQLDRLDASQLPSQLTTQLQPASVSAALPASSQQTLTPYILALLLSVLLMESFFAWRFGTSRQ